MPEISVVLPTYNGERYLKQSIESIINQTYDDWELIIVDDCSTDKTSEIIEEYAEKDSRICIIHNRVNQKLPKSLNIGFKAAKGNFLTWTSDDNYYDSYAFEIMRENLIRKNADFVFCSYCVIDGKGNTLQKQLKKTSDINMLPYKNVIGACFMYRKQVLEKVRKYNEKAFLVEDWEYWIRVYLQRYKMIAIGKVLYYYREHEKSLTTQREREIKEAVTRILLKMYFNKKISKIQKKIIYREVLDRITQLYGKREAWKYAVLLPIYDLKKDHNFRKSVRCPRQMDRV